MLRLFEHNADEVGNAPRPTQATPSSIALCSSTRRCLRVEQVPVLFRKELHMAGIFRVLGHPSVLRATHQARLLSSDRYRLVRARLLWTAYNQM